ncbi:DEAD-box ATP-dependent RNA helicase 20-like [Pyrus ussuriensis x Pyrus communis]|uniref:DEAD-box ATP-dependent RNA helicase 20-like n=1 Tax=Pyrus ussuriensis x Pyrus communis TaxID=2448454 RepID=A0A5N5GT13_9ROSA|nr:DEAD-box ATP-dependent RNA helicase 20-like [Pyrus ussuriensis x Pyrus communis]
MLLAVVLWAVVVARLSHHYGADAAQGTSNTAVKKYRRQWRKITAQRGTSETQDHLKREITTDGTSYAVDKVEKYRQRRGVTLLGRNVPNPIRIFDDSGFPSMYFLL